MSIGEWLAQSTDSLSRAGVDAPRIDCLVLLKYVLGHDKSWILAHLDQKIAPDKLQRLSSLLKRRKNREPAAYLVKSKGFYGLEIYVDNNVLIPRPETEALVEYIVMEAPHNGSLLDMGTGSGAIALAIKEHRADVSIDAADASTKVLEVAKHNSSRLKLNIIIVHSNLFDSLSKSYDVIAANLPYVPKSMSLAPELAFEPVDSLVSGSDGLDHYREFFKQVDKHLRPGGFILTEHDPSQLDSMKRLAQEKNFSTEVVTPFVSVFRRI